MKSIIDENIFDDHELYDLLQSAMDSQSNLKAPTLKNIILTTIDNIKKKYFFIKQEALYGKSFCDIGINSPNIIEEAIEDAQE